MVVDAACPAALPQRNDPDLLPHALADPANVGAAVGPGAGKQGQFYDRKL
jgi:hypothetical protein